MSRCYLALQALNSAEKNIQVEIFNEDSNNVKKIIQCYGISL